MALKTKKSIFAKEGEPAEGESREPYMVFDTKEDYDAAVAGELEKRGAPQPAEEPDNTGAPAPQTDADDERGRIISLWQRDAEMLKIIVPEFDLSRAIRNETFKNVLTSGGTVFEAYAAMVKPYDGAAGRDEIFQNAQNRSRGTGEAVVNPAKLSPEEFKKYIEERRNS